MRTSAREEHAPGKSADGTGAAAPAERPSYTEVIIDGERILAIIDALARHSSSGRVMSLGAEPLPVKLIECDPQLKWALAFGDAPFSGAHATALTIELDALNTTFRFSCDVIAVTASELVTSWPKQLLRIRRRWHRRTATSMPVVVNTKRKRSLSGRVRDISYNGISFELTDDAGAPDGSGVSDGAADDLEVGAMVELLAGPEAQATEAMVSIRHKRMSEDGNAVYSGAVEARDVERWQRLVVEALNPYTQLGKEWAPAQWELYKRAGYFSLSDKHPEHFAALKKSFEAVSNKLDDIPHLACSIVWPASAPGEAIATATMFRVYAHTWMGFQLAKISGSFDGFTGREILRRTLLHCYEHMQRYDAGVRWVAMYVQTKRTWSSYFMYELPLRYVEQGLAAIVWFRALEYRVGAPPPASPALAAAVDPRVVVRMATAAESQQVARSIAAMRPAMYCEALDLTPERIDFSTTTAPWQAAGLARKRALFVAENEGQLACAAVFELAEDGVHLFCLLDFVRAYPLVPGGERHIPALLEAAQAWFGANGKQRFIFMLEDDEWLPAEQRTNVVDMGGSDAVLLSVDRLPEFMEHLYEITAPRTSGEGTFRG